MNRSLERHLSRTLTLVILLAGLVACVVSFSFAYSEAQELQDDTLRKIAAVADINGIQGKTYEGYNADGNNYRETDPENHVIVMRLSANAAWANWLPAELQPGFHTLSNRGEDWRVFVRQAKQGAHIAVAQKTAVHDEIAIDSALSALIPLIVLLPLLVWLTARIVRAELAPLRRLAQTLDSQPAERPTVALSDSGLPDEVLPFVYAINRLLDRVTQLMDKQQRFIADAAHELRSPLTALSLQVQNLNKADTVEFMRERVAPLQAGIERARHLTEQLLNLAKSQARPPDKSQLDVSRMARELIAEYLPMAEARSIDLGLDDGGNIVLAAERNSLNLILRNALENALRYAPPHSQVTLRLYNEGQDALMEVIDTGPGIPAAERERVFDPFYRIEGAQGEGSGLGLAIARDAAMQLGGTVSLHGRANGSGLVFRYRQRQLP